MPFMGIKGVKTHTRLRPSFSSTRRDWYYCDDGRVFFVKLNTGELFQFEQDQHDRRCNINTPIEVFRAA
jgi:hypothetical protein